MFNSPFAAPVSALPAAAEARHPPGLYALFFTEMWERFSYYGMRALLVLFMVDQIQAGGLGLTDKVATSIYGLYTAAVYLAALPGGWVADRILGARQAVWWGGIIIAMGHFTLAIPHTAAFYLGLMQVVIGTGLLKPNISAMVGRMYPEGGARRDAGFTIFYMGINLGAALGPLVCSALGERLNWHYGFGAAGIGMILGLVQFRLSRHRLGAIGEAPDLPAPARARDRRWAFGALAVLVLLVCLIWAGAIPIDPVALARGATSVIVAIATLSFAILFLSPRLDPGEKRRVAVIAILLLASAMFWSGFEQAGSSLNLFAERHTQRLIGFAGFEVPAGWFQSFNPIFIITLAPVMAALWVALARCRRNPSTPVKFGFGLLLLAGGFLVMAAAARRVAGGQTVWPTWLIATYLLHSVGELCLSPVGLSSVTQLAPARLTGQMMGLWFLGTSLGNLMAGLLAGDFGAGIDRMPDRFLHIVITAGGTGLLLLLCARPIARLIRRGSNRL